MEINICKKCVPKKELVLLSLIILKNYFFHDHDLLLFAIFYEIPVMFL